MAEHTTPSQEIVHISHKKWMKYGRRKFDVSIMSGAGEIRESACRATILNQEFNRRSKRYSFLTHISERSLGPRAGSYRPPMFGLFRSSRSVGLTICFTEMRRISCAVRNEKPTLVTVEGNECAIFILD